MKTAPRMAILGEHLQLHEGTVHWMEQGLECQAQEVQQWS